MNKDRPTISATKL